MHEQVAVDAALGQEAHEHAKQRLRYEFDRFHLATEQRIAMIAMGTLGQLVFKQFLKSLNVPFQFQLQYGRYDDYDFRINDKIVEVKSSGYNKPNEWTSLNAIYNASQLEQAIAKRYDCSVQLFLNGYDKTAKLFDIKQCDTAIIAGWLEIEKIANTPARLLPYGKAHLIPLGRLHAIRTLWMPNSRD